MGKIKKSFRDYTEENDGIRKKPLKKQPRNNYKKHLMDVVENEDWDELEDDLYEQGGVRRR